MASLYPDFERPIVELMQKIQELELKGDDPKTRQKLERLKRKLRRFRKEIYSKLSPWKIVQVARHPERPYTLDYVQKIFTDFVELAGDRRYGEDPAIVAGFARLNGESVAIIGHQKGRTMEQKIQRNFGMPHPEGYRKALRVMKLAEKFGRPVFTFVDTPGAYPGIGAEARGQAEAIAVNLREMARLQVPIIVTIIGEGGSGGALAIAVGDRILMLEFAIYSVISPEGCASILWRNAGKAEEAAEALKLTARDLYSFGIIDEIVPEPLGGAHADPDEMVKILKEKLVERLIELKQIPLPDLLQNRYEKFRKMGVFEMWKN